ncbi:PilC/PilY family type IV pilus protein [Aquabacterium sp.]|uniref:PilC/PilY family type IV pilus protein n=1 Tax=Aquabacterium sp. TaxID=1872578 RepID=UPI002488E5CC|nr:PilC/PilY family type IV pilus protein [Aquabacterium sp.]MDI1259811.1 PilC/PilY family type IV pilus protein [Aquabacterium sp.]
MISFPPLPQARRKALALFAAVAFISLNATAPVWAALAQKPLLASTGDLPSPNIMLTIDSSGSMNFRHMPESRTTVNGTEMSVTQGGTWKHHQDDTYETSVQLAGTMPAKKDETDNAKLLTQIKLRSPDINTIYYNPRQRYKPWAATATTRYPDASINKAFIDPVKQAATDTAIDLTSNLSEQVCLEYGFLGFCRREARQTVFWPGLYYLLNDGANPTVTGNYVVHDINDSTQVFAKYPNRDDCLGSTCTQKEERQNFANWFVYYRTRMLLAKAALSEAFYKMNNVARVGWTTIKYASQVGNRVSSANPLGPIQDKIKPLTPTNRQALLNAIQTKWAAEGSTPLRIGLDQVGKYFMDDSNNSPWSDDPVGGSNNKSACRRSFNILTTDGYYNDTLTLNQFNDYASRIDEVDQVGNLDGSDRLPNYRAVAPYKDSFGNTLADFALKYWMTDLQQGVNDNIKPSTSNPATWQHLTQFTMGIGVSGTFDPSRSDQPNRDSDLKQLTDGVAQWPNPQGANATRADQAKIDDLWHAAINSRGAFYSVKDAQSLAAAVRDAIGRAESMDLREGGVATTSLVLEAGNRKYVPEYSTVSWRGELFAFDLNLSGGLVSTTPMWQASTGVPAFGSRNLWIWSPDNGLLSGAATPFTWDDMGATNQGAIVSGSAKLVNFLRGDVSNEGTGDTQFRPRQGAKLPDFINASPLYVSDGTNSVIFLGGNGGFAHAFRASDGVEVFGFMPRGVLPNVHKLADQNYGLTGGIEHQYFVDGAMATGTVQLRGTTNANVLVGTLGAGGKGLYALNITNLGALGRSTILWDNTVPSSEDVGHIFSAPEIGQLPNGQWKIFTGNGYDSVSGKSALLVIDVDTGRIDSVVADNADGNGLGGVRLVRNNQNQVVAAYAGDLKGQLWRFEYQANGAQMVTGYQGKPLFTATDSSGMAQAITAAPAAFLHPRSGVMVLFGTGKLLTEDDKTNTRRQSVYGVWDKTRETDSTSASFSPFDDGSNATADRLQLVTLSISANAQFADYFNVTQDDPSDTKTLGWYMDLTIAEGQRLIYPIIPIDEFALIGTVVPSSSAAECALSQGVGYNFLLPALTGAQYSKAIYDVNGDGLINDADAASAGYRTRSDGGDTILRDQNDSRKVSIQNTGGQKGALLPPPPKCTDPAKCPDFTILDRVWKRLINTPQN